MISTNSQYQSIVNGAHTFEHRILLEGADGKAQMFGDADIASLKITGGLFSENKFGFGGCFAREIELEFYPSATPPARMAGVTVMFEAVNDSKKSGLNFAGTFFIDTRETNDLGLMRITGYDSMLKAEKLYIDPGDVGQWPKKMSEVAADIASKMDVELDSRCSFEDYDVQLPTGYTMREVLSFIAAAHAGNWVITPEGKLRLIRVNSPVDAVLIDMDVMDFKAGIEQSGWTHVIVNTGDDTYVEAGTDDGDSLEVFCPWGTSDMADDILAALDGYVYRPYEARGAILDPAYEIGDRVQVNGTISILASVETTHDALCAADISAPTDNEIDHEYPYISSLNRQIKRRLQTIETTLYVGPESIIASVKDIDGRITQVSQTADKINWLVASGTDASNFTMTDRAVELVSASINLTGYVTFNSLTEAGSTNINGANVTTGKIAAERIDVSELKVQKVYSNTGDVVIDARFDNTVVIGGELVGWPDAGEILLTAPVVKLGYFSVLELDSSGNTITADTYGWELGSAVYPFEYIYSEKVSVGLGGLNTAVLTAIGGKLLVNGSEVLTGDLAISAIKSGAYSLTISGSSIAPSSTDITLGSATYYFDQIFTKELKLCYSSTKSLALSCGYSGELLINGDEYVPSKLVYGTYELELSSDGLIPSSVSIDLGTAYDHFGELYSEKLNVCRDKFNYATLTCDSSGYLNCSTSILPSSTTSYDLGSPSRLWNYLHTKTVRVYYNSYTYVDLACNYNGQLTAGGSVVATT